MNGYKRNILRKYMKDEPQLISGTYCTVAEYFASEFDNYSIMSIMSKEEAAARLARDNFNKFKNFNIISSIDYNNNNAIKEFGKYFFTRCVVLKYIRTHLYEHFPLRQYTYMRDVIMENIFFTRVVSLKTNNVIFERTSSKPALHAKFEMLRNRKLSFDQRENEKNLRLHIIPLMNGFTETSNVNWINTTKNKFYNYKNERFTLDYLLTENTLFKFENKFMDYKQYNNAVLKSF